MDLQAFLAMIERQHDTLREEVRLAMISATPEPFIPSSSWSTDRYVIIRPDGRPYSDVPGFAPYPGPHWQQRPAGLRAMGHLPGARLWDKRDDREAS